MQLKLPEAWEKEAAAIKPNRSVTSVRKELSLFTLNETRPKTELEEQRSKIAWVNVEKVSEPGEYKFRDGIIRIRRKHLNIWKRDPDATFTLVRFVPSTGTFPIYGLYPDNFLEDERRT